MQELIPYVTDSFETFNRKPPTLQNIPLSFVKQHTKKRLSFTFLLIALFSSLPAAAIYYVFKDDGIGGGLVAAIIVWLIIFIIFAVQTRRDGITLTYDKTITEECYYSSEERNTLFEKAKKEYNLAKNVYEKRRKQHQRNLEIIIADFRNIIRRYWQECSKGENECERIDNPKRGVTEESFFAVLMREFPEYVKVDISVFGYFPDIIINVDNVYFIDIEIDEPYTITGGLIKDIHWIGCGDDDRDRAFVVNDWFVLRFSEAQIKKNINECLMIVKNLIGFIKTGNCECLSNIMLISEIISAPKWTKEEARLMGVNNSRNLTPYRKEEDDFPLPF